MERDLCYDLPACEVEHEHQVLKHAKLHVSVHRQRLKRLLDPVYTQREAEAAVGLSSANSA